MCLYTCLHKMICILVDILQSLHAIIILFLKALGLNIIESSYFRYTQYCKLHHSGQNVNLIKYYPLLQMFHEQALLCVCFALACVGTKTWSFHMCSDINIMLARSCCLHIFMVILRSPQLFMWLISTWF